MDVFYIFFGECGVVGDLDLYVLELVGVGVLYLFFDGFVGGVEGVEYDM